MLLRTASCEGGNVNNSISFRRYFWRLLSLALLVGGLGTLPALAQAGDAITIGVIMPITGREAKPGQYQREGIELAIKQINDGGGIMVKDKVKKLLGKQVFYDDGSDSAKSAALTDRAMSSHNATAVLGANPTRRGEPDSVLPGRY